MLARAQQAFLSVLDQFNLEQILKRRGELVTLLDDSLRHGVPGGSWRATEE
jgi:hypothetical protein